MITHQGEFSTYTVKEFSKLIGKDVIKAHQLLKNDIPLHEYWLVTDNTFSVNENKESMPKWLEWMTGKKHDEADEIGFSYSMLTPLKENLPPAENEFGIKGPRVPVITVQKEFNESIDTMFKVAGDISTRPKWADGVQAVENITKPIQQIGTAHNCVAGKNVSVLITSGFKKDDKSITIEETDNKRSATSQVMLEKKGENKTLMTFTLFLKKNPIMLTVFNLFMKKKYIYSFKKSMENLEVYLNAQKVQTA